MTSPPSPEKAVVKNVSISLPASVPPSGERDGRTWDQKSSTYEHGAT